MTRAGVEDFDLQNLTLPMGEPDLWFLRVHFEGKDLQILLRKNSQRTPDFRVYLSRGGQIIEEVAPPPVRTYTVERVSGIAGPARGWASLENGRLEAEVTWNDGEERSLGVLPAGSAMPAFPGHQSIHGVFDTRHMRLPSVACGTDGQAVPQGPGTEGAGPLITRVAAVLDACYVDSFASIPGDDIAQAIGNADAIHARENLEYGVPGIDIQHQVSGYVIETQGPANCGQPTVSSATARAQLRDDWNQNFASFFPHVANVQLFTGQEFLDFPVIGRAFFAGICDPDRRYAVNNVTYSGSIISRAALVAHERGHNWNASHCDGNPTCGIMRSAINPGASFGTQAMNEIGAYRGVPTCTGPAPGLVLPFTDAFSGPALDGDHWRTANLVELLPSPLDPGDTMLAFRNPAPTTLGVAGELESEVFDFFQSFLFMADLQLSFVMFAPNAAPGSFLEIQVRNRNGLWETADTVRTEALNGNQVSAPFEVRLRWDEIHFEGMQIRLRGRNLGPGQVVYLDDLALGFDPLLDSVLTTAGVMATGDLNRDGHDDLVVGRPSEQGFQGTVEVYLSGEGLDASFTGLLPFEGLGASVSVLEDLDQDGLPELAVGGSGFQLGADGVVRIFRGSGLAQNPPALIELFPAVTGSDLEGFGDAVTGLGLVDGDLVPDFAVGAPRALNALGQRVGAVYVHSGVDGTRISGATQHGEQVGDRFGASLSTLERGDTVEGPDLVVGMRYVPTTTPRTGYIKTYSGRLAGGQLPLLRRIDDTFVMSRLEGAVGDPRFGYEVEGLDDFDGDGFSDVAVGIIGTRRDIPGGVIRASGHVLVVGATPATTLDVLVPGEPFEGVFGVSIANAGDLNQDGLGDFLIGDSSLSRSAPFASVINGGGIYAMVGPEGTLSNQPGPGRRYFLADYGTVGGQQKGRWVAAGDLNGDGRSDLIDSNIGSEVSIYTGYRFSDPFTGAAPGTTSPTEDRPAFLRMISNPNSSGYTLDVEGLPVFGSHQLVFGDSVLSDVGFLGLNFLANPQVAIPIVPDLQGNFTFSYVPPVGGGEIFHQILTVQGPVLSGSNIVRADY